jgi:hypothetical protein
MRFIVSQNSRFVLNVQYLLTVRLRMFRGDCYEFAYEFAAVISQQIPVDIPQRGIVKC